MIAFLDCNNLAYRAYFTTGDLSHGGNPTGVIYGFFNQLLTFLKTVGPGVDLVFCWDGQGSLRKEVYPEYKQNRVKTEEEKQAKAELYEQFDKLRGLLLSDLGWQQNVWRRDGYEADDLIAWGVQHAMDPQRVIVSGDEDLYQLLGWESYIFKPGKNILYSVTDFRRKYRIGPKDFAYIKALTGCDTDNVPGVPGVGDKTAVKYFLGQLKPTTKAYKAIIAAKAAGVIDRNLKLVTVPFGDDWTKESLVPQPVALRKRDFAAVFEQHGMKSLLARMGEFSMLLGLR